MLLLPAVLFVPLWLLAQKTKLARCEVDGRHAAALVLAHYWCSISPAGCGVLGIGADTSGIWSAIAMTFKAPITAGAQETVIRARSSRKSSAKPGLKRDPGRSLVRPP